MDSSSHTTTTTTTRRTIVEEPVTYRPVAAHRQVIVNRTSLTPKSESKITTTTQRQSYQSNLGDNAGPNYSLMTSTGVNAVKADRDQEKKDMQDLNDRFANYIDKVRYLEAQNRKLADELEKLKSKWGKETSYIKAQYQAELDEARHQLDDAEKEKARLEIRIASLEEQIEELRQELTLYQQIATLNRDKVAQNAQMLTEYEYEITSMRKRVEQLEADKEKDKKKIADLEDMLRNAREKLDEETLAHVDAENRRQTLEEEIEFLKSIHEQEMKELAALAYRDANTENRDFWKNEMSNALKEIQQMYDDKMDTMRVEMENNYTQKLSELRVGATRGAMDTNKSKEDTKIMRDQVTELRNKISDMDARNSALMRELEALRREKDDKEREMESANAALYNELQKLRHDMEQILRELQTIMDTKLGLELEIAAYRKLLEGEEQRHERLHGSNMLINSMSSYITDTTTSKTNTDRNTINSGEMVVKHTYQRTSKGDVAFTDCTPDGKSVSFENTGNKEEKLEGWVIRRSVDGSDRPEFSLDSKYVLKPKGKITIWAKGSKIPTNSYNHHNFEANETSWGIGGVATTKFINPDGDERATHVQRTVYE